LGRKITGVEWGLGMGTGATWKKGGTDHGLLPGNRLKKERRRKSELGLFSRMRKGKRVGGRAGGLYAHTRKWWVKGTSLQERQGAKKPSALPRNGKALEHQGQRSRGIEKRNPDLKWKKFKKKMKHSKLP